MEKHKWFEENVKDIENAKDVVNEEYDGANQGKKSHLSEIDTKNKMEL